MGGATAVCLALIGLVLCRAYCHIDNPLVTQAFQHADEGSRAVFYCRRIKLHHVAFTEAASTQSRRLQQEQQHAAVHLDAQPLSQGRQASRLQQEQQHAAVQLDAQPLSQGRQASQGGGKVSAGAVFVLTMLMAAASCLGAVPFFFVGKLSTRWSALANAIACGVMLAASFDLVHEGEPSGAGLVIAGVVLGALFIWASQRYLEQFEDVKFETLRGANARKVLLVVGIMTAHALGEGSGVGVSFCGKRGWSQGVLVTMAIGLHNVPEGLAVATVLVAKGISPMHAFWWTLATSLPQPLLALPSFLFVDAFQALLPLALGFAAGCMVWMVFAELLPDALADAPHTQVATAATMSAAALEALRMGLHALEEWHSVSGRLGWEGSTLLQPTAELAIVAGLSLLVGLGVASTSLADMPKLAAASSILTSLGVVMLMDSTLRDGAAVSVIGSLVGAGALWQLWWLLQRGAHRRAAAAHRDLDIEAGVKSQSDSVSLRVFSTELPLAVNRWKGEGSPEKALGLISPRLGRPSSALQRKPGVQLYRNVSQLCTTSLILCALCEGCWMATAVQSASAYQAITHGFSRGAAMAAISAYTSSLLQQKGSGEGRWSVLTVSGLGPLAALTMLVTGVTWMEPLCPWANSICSGALLMMGLCVVRPLAWHTVHERTRTCYGLGVVVSLALLSLPYASTLRGFMVRHHQA